MLKAGRAAIPLATVLPPDAVAELTKAAAVKDPNERQRAIDSAVQRARYKYPKLYRSN